MRWAKAIITIIRLPNLLFIFLTQILVYYYLVKPSLTTQQILLEGSKPSLLALSTMLIAMAGYIINDYFDVKIDEINKPHRVTVELQFKRRWIMGAHILLNLIALFIALPVALQSNHVSLIGIQILSIIYLLAYSAMLKKEAFTGNICIAILTALCVLTPAFYEYYFFKLSTYNLLHIYFFVTLFFAFAATWLREIAKDLEDLKGDAIIGCSTMPIKYGLHFTKKVMYLITSVLILVGLVPIIAGANKWFNLVQILFILLPLFFLLYKIYFSKRTKDFKTLSLIIKLITFAGILSIILMY